MKIVPPFTPRISTGLAHFAGATHREVDITAEVVTGVEFTNTTRLSVDASRLEGVTLAGLTLDKLEMTDTSCMKLEAAGLQTYKANLLRAQFMDCRMTGAEFAEGHFEDCVFRNVKFDEAGFRFTSFKRVRFENCILRQADFSNAKFEHVTFTGCDLVDTNFMAAKCTHVDITHEDLTLAKGLLGLKGATISTEQLMQLAPLLAAELGFVVQD